MQNAAISVWRGRSRAFPGASSSCRRARDKDMGDEMAIKRLFHFDVKTYANYGDTILFEAIRHLFNGYNGNRSFHVTGTRNLRHEVGPAMVKGINEHFDAAVIGGGGLFLRDTNANMNSGWQWNCSVPVLKKIEKPLILFAVGNNRFIGQEDFAPVFCEHVNLTFEKASFVGLRNRGSIESMKEYVRPELHEKIVYQPCITTIASHIFPDIFKPDLRREKRVGFQVTMSKRQDMGGFDKPAIYKAMEDAIVDLKRRGWEVEIIAHVKGDEEFYDHLASRGINTKLIVLHHIPRGLYEGMKYYSTLPITVGMRGHGQMIPFGVGNGIISIQVHNKLRYFLRDVNHEQYCINPRSEDLKGRLLTLVDDWYEDFDNKRAAFGRERQNLFDITMSNMKSISTALGADEGDGQFSPYSSFARELSITAYNDSMHRDAEGSRALDLARKNRLLQQKLLA
ncbi:polysaccharide pyruvyl transferase family protein [Sinorhizobium meliloti]|nr:polysaccharide pyruvyl transferase family protein [Sinorhizobium meliloti]